MARNRRIGILTGGGDVPGLNSVIKSVTYRATELGFEVFGIRRGWEGLTHQQPGAELDERYVIPLDRVNTRTIDRTGGTWLHTLAHEPAQDDAARRCRRTSTPRAPSRCASARTATTSRPSCSRTSRPGPRLPHPHRRR